MHYGNILTADIGNGEGMRLTLFVSGCTIHCKDCFNEATWDFNYGKLWTKKTEDDFITELKKTYYHGMTILGGEPFEPENQPELCSLILRVKEELPDKNIWMFSGNLYDINLIKGGSRYTKYTDKILDNIDVLVDGPFIKEKHKLGLNFRGSQNQRIIDMKKTRKEGKVILHPLNNDPDLKYQKNRKDNSA